MRKIFDKIMQKSERERQQIAFMGAGVLTLLIAVIWGANMLFLNQAPDGERNLASVIEANTREEMTTEEDGGFIDREFERVKNGFNYVKDQLQDRFNDLKD